MKVFIDYETRSPLDIKKVGAYRYAEEAEILMMAYQWEDEDEPSLIVSQRKVLDWWENLEESLRFGEVQNLEIHARNAEFEVVITEQVLNIPTALNDWHCTALQCAYYGIPRALGQAAITLGTGEQKDKRGETLINLLCKPRKPTKKDPSIWNEDPALMAELGEYCKQDVRTDKAIHEALPPLPERERKIWALTVKQNRRGVAIDEKFVKSAQKYCETKAAALDKQTAILSKGGISSARQTARVKSYFDMDKGDSLKKKDVTRLLKEDAMPEGNREILQIRQEVSRSSTAKLGRMLEARCKDGRIHGQSICYGASTGRPTGSGVQLLNLPKPIIDFKKVDPGPAIETFLRSPILYDLTYPKPLSMMSCCIRGALIGDPILSDADFNAIELRVLLWLAGDKEKLKLLEQGVDLYTMMARKIYNDETITKKTHPLERDVGKKDVLSCGYALGRNGVRFQAAAEEDGLLITLDFAKKCVAWYRKEYPAVQKYWKDINEAAVSAIHSPGRKIKFGPLHFGTLMIPPEGRSWLYMQLPSGRKLWYYKPRAEQVKKVVRCAEDRCPKCEGTKEGGHTVSSWVIFFTGVDAKTKQVQEHSMHGGIWTENACQAIAWDIMADLMLRLEDRGVKTLFSVYDEVVAEGDHLDMMVEEGNKVPAWASGLPLKIEGWKAERYKKE